MIVKDVHFLLFFKGERYVEKINNFAYLLWINVFNKY